MAQELVLLAPGLGLGWRRCRITCLVALLILSLLRGSVGKELRKEDIKDVCTFYAAGRSNVGDPWNWGPYHICDTSAVSRWLDAAAGNCYDCAKRRPVCGHAAPTLLFHVYFNKWSDNWKFDIQVYKSFLLTQNLQKSHMIVWVDNATTVLEHPAGAFLDTYKEYITVRSLPPWHRVLVGTPLQGHRFWSDHAAVKKNIYTLAGYADVLRLLLLYQHGGVWLDTDVILLQDLYPPVIQVGFQFSMRWTNNHVMYLRRASPLARRMLDLVATMPYTNEETAKNYVEKICKPKGYMSAHSKYGYTDIYNMCVHKLVSEFNNTADDPDAVLFTRPLGWYDNDWPGCLASRDTANDTMIDHVLSTHMALHSRLISDNGFQPHSLHSVVTELLDDFFVTCQDIACLPRQGMRLATYLDVVARFKQDAGGGLQMWQQTNLEEKQRRRAVSEEGRVRRLRG